MNKPFLKKSPYSTPKERLFLIIAAIIICVLMAVDISADYIDGASLEHMSIELVIFTCAACSLLLLTRNYFHKKHVSTALNHQLSATQHELSKYRSELTEHLQGLANMIEQQFDNWKFTPAEKEIGFLLIKGFSFKEIAAIRHTEDRTVRQQSLVIYRKATVKGRAEFSAFFLEDLLPPQQIRVA